MDAPKALRAAQKLTIRSAGEGGGRQPFMLADQDPKQLARAKAISAVANVA